MVRSFASSITHFEDSSTLDLIMIIRKLWFSNEIENNEIYETNERLEKEFLPGIITRFEFYARQNHQFTILHRYDTIIKITKSLKMDRDELLASIITESLRKTSAINISNKMKTGTKKNWEDVDLFSTQQHKIPILATKFYKKGVYMSYDEFKNNKPSVPHYEVRSGKLGDMLIIKDMNGVTYPIRKIWRFCDGKKIYIMSADNFFPIYFTNNTVYTKATKILKRSSGKDAKVLAYLILPLPLADGFDRSGAFEKYELLLKPYQLDLESGKLY